MTPEFAFNRLPDDVTKNYPVFTKFMQAYYNWGQEHGFDGIINNSRDLLYQQVYNKEYEDRVIKNLGIDISIIEGSPIKTELLYKLVNEFLETRGTKTSYEILFRMMFNKQVSVTYSRDSLFKTSASNYLRTSLILMSGLYPLSLYSKIRGLRSNTTTGIESFIPFYINNTRYYIVECNNIYDEFVIGEPLEITNLGYSYNEVHIPLVHLDIITPGTLYKKGDILYPSNNLFAGNFIVKSVTKGTIDDIEIVNGGTGYKQGDKILTAIPSHFDAFVTGVDLNGSIMSVKIRNKGYNFDHIPEYKIKTTDGTGAVLKFKTTTIGNIKEIEPDTGSVIYDNKPISYYINSEEGTGLQIRNKVVPCYYVNRYTDNVGFLSYNSRILNSENHHSHSYNITSSVPAVKYSKIIDKYVNPSGYSYNKIYVKENKITIPHIEVAGELIRE